MIIYAATSNPNKIKEYREAIASYEMDVQVESVFDKTEKIDIEETGKSYLDNARLKAQAYAKKIKKPVLGDDGGLEIKMLPNLFGLYTNRTFPEGLTDSEKNEYILKLLKGKTDREAKLVAALCLVFPDQSEVISEVEIPFTIAYEELGDQGFGFDPILYVPDLNKTTAQLSDQARQSYSARSLALVQLLRELENE